MFGLALPIHWPDLHWNLMVGEDVVAQADYHNTVGCSEAPEIDFDIENAPYSAGRGEMWALVRRCLDCKVLVEAGIQRATRNEFGGLAMPFDTDQAEEVAMVAAGAQDCSGNIGTVDEEEGRNWDSC
jgi:hypothetical protein